MSERKMRSDSLENRFGEEKLKQVIEEYYIKRQMKCEDVASVIKNEYGISCSDDSVLRVVKKMGVNRTKAKAISLAKCHLNGAKIITNDFIR